MAPHFKTAIFQILKILQLRKEDFNIHFSCMKSINTFFMHEVNQFAISAKELTDSASIPVVKY